jgi:predicted ArsR family transcriptional regulator
MEADAERTNASRVADITKIPRQTVRRKLQSLEARGWIERECQVGPIGSCPAGAQSTARRDLDDLDRRVIHRVARLVADLQTVIEKHEQRIDEKPISGKTLGCCSK